MTRPLAERQRCRSSQPGPPFGAQRGPYRRIGIDGTCHISDESCLAWEILGGGEVSHDAAGTTPNCRACASRGRRHRASGRRRGRRCRGRRGRPGWTGDGGGPWRTGRCGGRDGGGRRRGVITGPSAGGDHGDDDGGDDDDRRDRDGYPLAAALLLGTIAIRPLRSVPVALDVDVAARVRVPAGGLRRTCGLALAGTPGLLCPGAAVPVALAGGRMVRIWVPTWLSPFDQVNSSSMPLGPTSFAR